MADDIVQRLRGMRLPAGYNTDVLVSAADEIERLRAERDAAFAMSRCECDTDEACTNLIAHLRRAEHAEEERDALRARIEAAPVTRLSEDVHGAGALELDDIDFDSTPELYCALRDKRVRLVVEGE